MNTNAMTCPAGIGELSLVDWLNADCQGLPAINNNHDLIKVMVLQKFFAGGHNTENNWGKGYFYLALRGYCLGGEDIETELSQAENEAVWSFLLRNWLRESSILAEHSHRAWSIKFADIVSEAGYYLPIPEKWLNAWKALDESPLGNRWMGSDLAVYRKDEIPGIIRRWEEKAREIVSGPPVWSYAPPPSVEEMTAKARMAEVLLANAKRAREVLGLPPQAQEA